MFLTSCAVIAKSTIHENCDISEHSFKFSLKPLLFDRAYS